MPILGKRDFRCFPHFGRFDFEETRQFEVEHARKDIVREVLRGVVVLQNRIVESAFRARGGCLFRITSLLDQMHGNDAVNDPQYLARDQPTAGEEKTYGPHSDWNGKLRTRRHPSSSILDYLATL